MVWAEDESPADWFGSVGRCSIGQLWDRTEWRNDDRAEIPEIFDKDPQDLNPLALRVLQVVQGVELPWSRRQLLGHCLVYTDSHQGFPFGYWKLNVRFQVSASWLIDSLLRVAFVIVSLVIVSVVFVVFFLIFVWFFVWLFSKPDIGINRGVIRNIWVEVFRT